MRMRRMMLGMSQEKLAADLGLTFQQVQKYEKGANRMGSSRLQNAADILGVAVPFFFRMSDRPRSHRMGTLLRRPTSTISFPTRKAYGWQRHSCRYDRPCDT
jgi:transcriptional regulator with XRE-family HTH domain